MSTVTKICIKCKDEKPLNEFNKQKKGRFGRHNQCKACTKKENIKHRGSSWENYFQITPKRKRDGLTVEDIISVLEEQDGKCALTGITLTRITGKGRVPTNASIDRIDPGGPYIKENIQLVCSIVNQFRGDLEVEQFLWWCKKVVDYDK